MENEVDENVEEAFDEQKEYQDGQAEFDVIRFKDRTKALNKDMLKGSLSKLEGINYGRMYTFTKLICVGRKLTDIGILTNFKYLRYVYLSGNFINDISPLSNCESLLYLKFDHNRLRRLKNFGTHEYLQIADFSSNKIAVFDLESHPMLKNLSLNHNIMSELSHPDETVRFPALLKFSARSCLIGSIKNLSPFENVFYLNLALNQIKEVRFEIFSLLKNLIELDLSSNPIEKLIFPESDEDLPQSLVELNLANTKISNKNMTKSLYRLESLRMLSLLGSTISKSPNYRTVLAKYLPKLIKLDKTEISSDERDLDASISSADGGEAKPAGIDEDDEVSS